MNDPSACREILRGVGTPFETAHARGISRQNLQSQLACMLVGGSIVANAIMEDYTTLARREEETIWLRAQEEAMMKTTQAAEAANAALVKEKTAAEAAVKEAETRSVTALKEAEAHAAKELVDANADRTKLNKVVEELQEARDGLATSLVKVTDDHAWMRQHGIRHIVEAILNAPENATAVTDMNECARQAGFKAAYEKCLNDVNPFFSSKFTNERSGFHGVDTEAAYDVAVDAYNNLSIPTLDRIDRCLEAEDYVDRLHMLFNPTKEGKGTSGSNVE
ncbi:hypothetical protein HanRHA438_Chr10g0459331 [Helianthus annuus]|uniref:Uncharacterized protein n=1 Tax=Helianthus annuus TaxID=4232 RepID=A0A9K3N4W3_HELAN|nr:hypothetical protein HanXRQr2_Chr10g0446781 [Helianthus annuus]KAJ0522345.1 hypothetical protein HanIR_Chr10g0481621 [Helianthus annuus]KAJ0530367.1 hypothetical protein HanHA89_Chr10g0389121 [Helianthus annuus]KAJ0880097.1 hypothetical protein HanRHA438_Chr10g0459331 [Helianthus annuus]